MYCIVSPFSKTFDEVGFIYFIPDFLRKDLCVGQLVEIPIKNEIEDAIVLDGDYSINNLDFDISKIKSLISIKNKNIFLQEYQKKFIGWISKKYFCSIHNSLSLFFPKNLKEKLKKDTYKFPSSKEIETVFLKKEEKSKIILSLPQQRVYENIEKSLKNNFLLYGITGSGKTEIYIKLIEKILKKGQQSLLLIPEIILNNQIGERIKKVFGEQVIIINSSITEATKTKYWQQIYLGQSKVIVGTRSSLFYPYKNLGLIIIDEEHDNSYISDKSPRYKAVEIAEKMTELIGNKLILASGTPSINTMYRGVKGEFQVENLLEKYS